MITVTDGASSVAVDGRAEAILRWLTEPERARRINEAGKCRIELNCNRSRIQPKIEFFEDEKAIQV